MASDLGTMVLETFVINALETYNLQRAAGAVWAAVPMVISHLKAVPFTGL